MSGAQVPQSAWVVPHPGGETGPSGAPLWPWGWPQARGGAAEAPGPQPSDKTRGTSDGRKAPGQAEPGGPRLAGDQLPLAAPTAPGTSSRHRLAQAAAGQHAALGELVTAQVSCREGGEELGSARGRVRELPRAPALVMGCLRMRWAGGEPAWTHTFDKW